MILSRHFTSRRAIRAASFLIVAATSFGCERARSSASVDTSKAKRQGSAASSTTAQGSAGPESSPEAMRAFAAAHLRPGLKPGDFLTDKADYPTGDTADVYRAVLDTLYVSKDGFPGQVVLNDFAITGVWTCSKMPCPILPTGTGSEPKLETIDAYRIARLNRRHITPKFKYHIPLQLMGEKEQREMEIDGRSIALRDSVAGRRNGMREVSFWLGFQARYPHAWGYAVLSVVGMNPQKNEAILQVLHQCGTYCHSTETMVLWKVRGQWHVIERVPEEGDSTDLGSESLRYRGVGAHTPLHEMQESARRDSLRQAALPRDIHGKITTRDGAPVQGARVTLHTGDNPNVPSGTSFSDALGNYRFDNPPVGGAGLMVRCPRTSSRPDSLAVVTATDVAIGKSVEVNIPIDRAACSDTTAAPTVRTIQPPINGASMENLFDAARASKATYPDAEGGSIYGKALEAMGMPDPGKVFLVYATTRSTCQGTSCQGDYMRRIRYEPSVMMSTMENFLSVREQRLDLRAGFPWRPGFTLIGDSAVVALERAASRGNALNDIAVVQRAWPAVERVYSVSPIGFSPRHEQAMVEVMRPDGSKTLCILNRNAFGWQVVRMINE